MTTTKKLLLALFFGFGLPLIISGSASAATITVDTTADNTITDGDCTLREAIHNSNGDAATYPDCTAGSGPDTIAFGIPGAGPHTITPTSPTPFLTDETIIDGTTQPGASCGTLVPSIPAASNTSHTLLIEIDGSSAGSAINLALVAGSEGSTIRGIVSNNAQGIDGTTGYGLSIFSDDNLVECNYVGTDVTGTAAEPNYSAGIAFLGTTGNTIRNNLSSGNTAGGLLMTTSSSTTVNNNIFGLNVSGTAALANGINGIGYIGSPSNLIRNNIISGNSSGANISTLVSSSDDQTIIGNIIGLDITATAPIGNTIGVFTETNDSIFGGPLASDRNYVSGNGAGVVNFVGDDNRVENNYIGTDHTGTADVGNSAAGIVIIGERNEVIDNLVSANDGLGIALGDPIPIIGGMANFTVVQGNIIGADVTGEVAMGNALTGITVAGNNNLIGGISDGQENVIVGNGNIGLAILGSAVPGFTSTENRVVGNLVGITRGGQSGGGFSNSIGIGVAGDAEDNIIGGTTPAEANIVVGNASFGVVVSDTPVLGGIPVDNTIIGNSIYDNGSVDIDLASDSDGDYEPDTATGVNPNDVGDVDVGANNYLNFPELTSVRSDPGEVTVTFDLDVDETESEYRVEFFASRSADATGHGPGEVFLGFVNVPGDVNDFTASLTPPPSIYDETVQISATVTEIDGSWDGFGSTSEYAEAREVTILPPALADTGLSISWQILGIVTSILTATMFAALRTRFKVFTS